MSRGGGRLGGRGVFVEACGEDCFVEFGEL